MHFLPTCCHVCAYICSHLLPKWRGWGGRVMPGCGCNSYELSFGRQYDEMAVQAHTEYCPLPPRAHSLHFPYQVPGSLLDGKFSQHKLTFWIWVWLCPMSGWEGARALYVNCPGCMTLLRAPLLMFPGKCLCSSSFTPAHFGLESQSSAVSCWAASCQAACT